MSDPNHELLPRLTRYLDYFQALTEVGKALTQSLEPRVVLDTVMHCLSQLLKPKHWSLLLVDETKAELYFEIAVGDAAEKLRELRLPLGEGIAGWVARHKEPLVVARVADDPRFSRRADTQTNFQTSSILAVPLLCRGRVVGVIELVKDMSDPEPYRHEDLEILAPLADFAAIAIDNARTFKRVEELTLADEWTGLFNARYLRTSLVDEAARAERYGRQLALVFFDLDNFKMVNDTRGHAVGSALLKNIGAAIRDKVRETDRLVRYGGDEFVLVMPETSKAGAMAMAERLRLALVEASHVIDGHGLTVQASFGVASFPEDAKSAEALLEAADRAMYVAKSRGRNCVVDASTTPSQPHQQKAQP